MPDQKDKDLPGWQGEVHHVNPSAYRKNSPVVNIPTIAAQRKHPALLHEALIMSKSPRPKPSHHASTVVELSDGEFMAAWFGGAFEGKPDVGIWTSTWRRGADSWSPPAEVVKPLGAPTWNPVLFKHDASGELLLFYKVGQKPLSWKGFLKRSSDDGKTWGPPEELGPGIVGPAKNKPIELEDGTILSGSSDEGGRDGKEWTTWVEESRDKGRTWSRIGPIELEGRIIQPSLFRGKSGDVRMVIRTRKRFMALAKGNSAGHGWSNPTLTDIPCPNSGIDAVALRDGRILLVYNHSFKRGVAGRSVLSVALSHDDGETWKRVLTLEDTGSRVVEFSYPAVIQARNGEVLVSYTWGRQNIKVVLLDPKKL
uniref:Alpha-rhamnosidase-like protein n=1 Tax=Tetraselmis sp. GSL018 TaxID=582737 RepID=A0A061SIA7_9CHLO